MTDDGMLGTVTGLIFAGGLARRMDGREKALLPLRGRPLITHVIERFTPQVSQVIINAKPEIAAYAAFGCRVICDVLSGFAGPLAGLQAGLLACETPLLATAPCDAPLLPLDLVTRLHAALQASQAPVAVACTDGGKQPTFMLCRREVLSDLEKYLAEGGRKIHAWLTNMKAVEVAFADEGAFDNINTPEDLDRLERAS